MPSYTLAPDARVAGIARQIAAALVEVAARVKGPVRLTGHSAGGHLVTRLVSCARDGTSLLPADVAGRIGRVVSISGVHDLRPLLETAMNASIGLDAAEADAESPALLVPDAGIDVVTWVGQSERAEFIRQSDLLANIWRGLGAATESVVEPDRHHFDVIDGLTDPVSPLLEALLADGSRRLGAGEPA